MEVMEEVENWEMVVDDMGLHIPDCKLQEIKQHPSTGREKNFAVVEYWFNTEPFASWKGLAKTLYWKAEERAVAMAMSYLPKGVQLLDIKEKKKKVDHFAIVKLIVNISQSTLTKVN